MEDQRRIVNRVSILASKVHELEVLHNNTIEETKALWASLSYAIFAAFQNAPVAKIADICDVQGGLQKSPARQPNENPIPYLTVAHVQRNHIDLSIGLRYFEVTKSELERLRLLPGDLLIIEGNGSLEQIGRVALFNGEVENCVHQNHVIRARPNRECVLPEYLNAFLNSPVGQEEVQKRSRTTSGLRTLSVGKIREIEVPLPPIDQQRCIVQKLRQTEAKIENLLSHMQISQTEIQAVIPSFLHKAFQGHI